MKPRLNPYTAAGAAMQELISFESHVQSGQGLGIDPQLADLNRMRSSQITGCAFCINMRSTEAREHGESEKRLYLLDALRASPLYSPSERAALPWTEAVTRGADSHVPDETFAMAQEQFSEPELVAFTLLVTSIKAWNRVAIAFRSVHPVEHTKH